MKFLVALLLTALVGYAASLFLPWWIVAPAAFAVALVVKQSPAWSFLAGFAAIALLWGVHAFILDAQNHHLLATRVAGILPLGNSYPALIALSALTGGLVAGMAALTAGFLHKKQG